MTPEGSSGIVAVPERGHTEGTITSWGDKINKKTNNIFRIGFNNINGFKAELEHPYNREIQSFISTHQFDLFGISKINLNWKQCSHHVADCTRGWFKRLHINNNYFSSFPTSSKFQVGGVMQFVIDDATCRLANHGADPKGLGRWVWHSMRGKNQRIVRIISAYRPVCNEVNIGSTWNQQQFHADIHNIAGNPHDRWIADLESSIVEWINAGDSIILMVDLNEDVRSGKTSKTLEKLGLVELLSKRRGNSLPTHQRGTTTIDGIFATNDITPVQCGYLNSFSDHLGLWLYLDMSAIFGAVQVKGKSNIRRLQISNPKTVAKYNGLMWTKIQEDNMHQRIERFTRATTNRYSCSKEWETIDKYLTKLRLVAERQCRSLNTGSIQWTPDLANLRITIKFLIMARKRKQKIGVDRKIFNRIARRANRSPTNLPDIDILEHQLEEAKAQLRQYKQSHVANRASWLERLASAMAEHDNINNTDTEGFDI
jgi:hypothetical protein